MGKFSFFTSTFLSVVAVSGLTGCGAKPNSVQAPQDGAKLIALFEGQEVPATGTELLAEKQFRIAVPRAALRVVDESGKVTQKETEFLLSASTIPQASAPTSTAMNAKVIYFQLFEDALDMYESTEGSVVTGDLPATRLLAKFPVVSQDATKIVIDFDGGMKSLFISDWTSGTAEFDEANVEQAIDIPVTRVHAVTHTPGRLTISQNVQGRISFLGTVLTPRMDVRYYLTPYVKTEFVPKTVKQTRHVRYFKTYPRLEKESGTSRTHILKFDLKKPITFAYSANTPKEFQEAVRDGILYWNRAFGKEVVKAEIAPEGVTAPDPDHNVVQWVPWDSAGFAYADVIANPLGQSLHGQVYLTSVFGIKGVERARIALRQLQAMAEKAGESPKKAVLKGMGIRFMGEKGKWAPAGQCEQHAHEVATSMAKGLSSLLSLENVTDQRILQMSQNYVREVVAHEIGHVLGLRHHFAGNLVATLTAKSLGEWSKAALTEGKFDALPGKVPSSSVMEYTEYFAAAYVGQIIKEGKEVLPYDLDAIQWGYFDKNDVIDKKTLYCSDEEAEGYGDCERFDPTGDPFLGTHTDIAKTVQQLPGLFIEQFVAAVAPNDAIDVQKVEEVNLTATLGTTPIGTALRRSLLWFNDTAKVISVENQFPFLGPMNVEARLDARWADLQKKIQGVGGTDRLLFSFLPLPLSLDLAAQPEGVVPTVKFSKEGFVAKVNELLTGPVYSKFIGLDGKEHSFSEAERKVISERAKQYADYFEPELLKTTLTAFASTKLSLSREAEGIRDEDDVLAKVEKQYASVAKEVIMALDPTKTRIGKVRGALVTVQEFKYPLEVRLLAAKLLDRSLGSQPFWADSARGSIRSSLKSFAEGALLSNDLQNFKDTDLSRVLRTWLSEQKQVLAYLPE